ncbi:hypothetical protein NW754_015386 [Fusarium falciforme]|nr:hypothetical protein NW754_015386 [Fusarium falciforme]
MPEDVGVLAPSSEITEGNSTEDTTTPTVWLPRGATAEMEGVGASSLTFRLNSSLGLIRPYVSREGASSRTKEQFEWTDFFQLHSDFESDYREEDDVWNITLTVSLSFQGDIVRENSTCITSVEDGVPDFEKKYEQAKDPRNREGGGSDSAATMPLLDGNVVSLLALLMAAYIMLRS